MIEWRVVPIQEWETEPTEERRGHPFRVERWVSRPAHSEGGYTDRRSGVDWSATTSLLERELLQLEAENVVLQLEVVDKDIRLDGWIRANASPSGPGVILTFDSKYGPLSYPCDQFTEWQANVRAIALALEALRKVDRYGVTKRGEQYTGWKRLGTGGSSTSTMTARAAAAVLVQAEGLGEPDSEILLDDVEAFRLTYRAAAKRTHPDAGGSVEAFQRVHLAKQVIERHHGNGVAT